MSLIPKSGSDDIDGILWGVKWDLPALTYGFGASVDQYSGYAPGSIAGFEAFNATQKAAVHAHLAMLNGFIALPVNYVADGSQANIRFAEATSVVITESGAPGTIVTAYGIDPDHLTFPVYSHGDMFFNRTDYDSPQRGNYANFQLLHEMGHALGLKHGHDSQPYPDFSTTMPALPFIHDSMEYSVMTYRSSVANTIDQYHNERFGYAQSYMINDIAALQYIYGADYTYRAGNTVYSWNPKTGEMFVDGEGQGAPGANRVFLTIWDGGGRDTYDMSNYSSDLKINLQPGSFSVTSQRQLAVLDVEQDVRSRGNVFNALLHDGDLRSLIENAEGGSGNDKIYGNSGRNMLAGNGGADEIAGLDGKDRLLGGKGADVILGGAGSDVLFGDRGGDACQGGAGNDSFAFTSLSDGGDVITDFSHSGAGNNDLLAFFGRAFGGLAKGFIEPSLFEASTGGNASGLDTRFIFDTDDGVLRFDGDGSGALAAITIATLQPGALVTSSDILIY